MAEGATYYWDYLGLDALLGAQRLESTAAGRTAHDEMLFIVTHQAYELWFKQILWEIDAVAEVFAAERVDEKEMGQAVALLERVTEIQRLLLQQIEVLETMTPLDFLEFRDLLVPASGFQSVQFRLIEIRLGIDSGSRLRINASPYTAVLSEEHRRLLEGEELQPSLLSHVERWLERTPFVRTGSFDFWRTYRGAVQRMLDDERTTVEANAALDDATRAEHLAQQDATAETFAVLFDRQRYDALRAKGDRRLSYDAFLAALLITLYRDEPAFHMPHRLLQALVAIDEGFTAWRQRHALMVRRMIGGRIGTGGTTGYRYLRATAERHHVFRDLFDLPTFQIPRSQLPPIPEDVEAQMRFRYDATTA